MFTIAAGIILAGLVLGFLAGGVVIAIGFSPRSPVAWALFLIGLLGAATIFALADGLSFSFT